MRIQSNFPISLLILAAFVIMTQVVQAQADTPYLVKDINNIEDGTGSSNPAGFLTIGKWTYFAADDAYLGRELWKTDGTATGTVMVKDICLGPDGSGPDSLTNINGKLYFEANDGVHGIGLWKSDGTEAGTTLIKAIYHPRLMTLVNNTIFFTSGDGLWKTDGTEAGTVMVKYIRTGTNASIPFYSMMLSVNGILYFQADDGVHGPELWKSDGTAAGTVMVKDIHPGSGGSDQQLLTNLNGTLYFIANDGTHGAELWRSDGTAKGTVMVKDIYPGTIGSSPEHMIKMGGNLYFSADDGTHGTELWKSDGTASGTKIVKDIIPGATNSMISDFNIVTMNGKLYFTANDGVHGYGLWKSDGTATGTVRIEYDYMGYGEGAYNLTSTDGKLFFNNDYLYVSDGTGAGTKPLKAIYNHWFTDMTGANGSVVFQADIGDNGKELWKSDGTPAGTLMLKDIYKRYDSDLANLTNVNGTLFFTANDGMHGTELWKSNGSTNGTMMVKDIIPGINGSNPTCLTNVNGTLFFAVGNKELWKSDGTTTGTVMVYDTGSDGYSYAEIANVNGKIFFSDGYDLWKSDGTTSGTMLISEHDFPWKPAGEYAEIWMEELTNVNGILYFTQKCVVNDRHGELILEQYGELWKTDGTVSGTDKVNDFDTSYIGSLVNVNGILFFSYYDRLWKSDGTPEGTVQVTTKCEEPLGLMDVNGKLFFTALTQDRGTAGLWKSDGTSDGTVMVNPINTWFIDNMNTMAMTNVNGILFYQSTFRHYNNELWKTDGTAAGTVLVKDTSPGYAIPGTDYFCQASHAVMNGNLYFTAYDQAHGYELWKSDGTNSGTVRMSDIAKGPYDSFPQFLTVCGNRLFFRAINLKSNQGYELWAMRPGTQAGAAWMQYP